MQPFGRTPASTASMQGDEGVHAISAFVGPVVRSRHSKPCPAYFEISFLENAAQEPARRLSAIVFRNFYCSHISIKQRRDFDIAGEAERGANYSAARDNSSGIESEPWVTVLRDRAIMEDPHYEADAQDWNIVSTEEFDSEQYDASSTAPLSFSEAVYDGQLNCTRPLAIVERLFPHRQGLHVPTLSNVENERIAPRQVRQLVLNFGRTNRL